MQVICASILHVQHRFLRSEPKPSYRFSQQSREDVHPKQKTETSKGAWRQMARGLCGPLLALGRPLEGRTGIPQCGKDHWCEMDVWWLHGGLSIFLIISDGLLVHSVVLPLRSASCALGIHKVKVYSCE